MESRSYFNADFAIVHETLAYQMHTEIKWLSKQLKRCIATAIINEILELINVAGVSPNLYSLKYIFFVNIFNVATYLMKHKSTIINHIN